MKKITLLLLLLGVFAGYANNSDGGNDPCYNPVNMEITNVTPTSATFLWEVNGASSWGIIVVEFGSPVPDPNAPAMFVGEGVGEFTITTLVPCTHYSVYIRSYCGDSFGAWTGPGNFSTFGANIDGSLSEYFDTTPVDVVPFCWSAILSGTTLSEFATVKTVTSNPYSGSNSLLMSSHSSEEDSDLILVTPILNTLANGTHRLRFFARTGINIGSIEVGTVNSADEFNYLETVSITEEYAEYVVDFSDYVVTDDRIGIRHNSGAYTSLYLDNVVWEPAPLCADVSNIEVIDTTPDSVTLSWDANDGETEWDIVYGESYATDPTAMTPITPALTTNEGAVVNGLTANTSYNLWVRSVCPGDANGYWIGPVSFNTACLPATSFSENFDTIEADALPLCWSAIIAGETASETSYASIDEDLPYSGTKCIRINNTDSGAEARVMLVAPNLSNLSAGTHRLKFFARGDAAKLDVGTLDNNTEGATFTSLLPITLTNQYVEYVVDFNAYSGEDQYIALRNISELDYTSVYIDDVIWEVIPACPDVTSITVTDVTTTEATVNWEAGNGETNWQVSYGAAAITNPALATISEVVSETNFSTGVLIQSTAYKVWVRSVCGSTNGTWIGPVVFNTGCNAVATFSENFDSVSYPNFPVCWSKIVTGASEGSDVVVDIYSATTAPNGMLLYGAYSSAGADIILISPPVTTLAAGNYQLKFKGSGSLPLEIGTLNESTSSATFTPFSTVTLSEFGTQSFTVDFAAYSGTDTHIGFRLQTNEQNAYASLDDITWTQSLSSGSFDSTQFSYYPNPVKDVLNIAYDENITNITVFNLLGQKVMEYNANRTSVKLDMSALSSGSYIVKVAANDQVKSIKIIKQ